MNNNFKNSLEQLRIMVAKNKEEDYLIESFDEFLANQFNAQAEESTRKQRIRERYYYTDDVENVYESKTYRNIPGVGYAYYIESEDHWRVYDGKGGHKVVGYGKDCSPTPKTPSDTNSTKTNIRNIAKPVLYTVKGALRRTPHGRVGSTIGQVLAKGATNTSRYLRNKRDKDENEKPKEEERTEANQNNNNNSKTELNYGVWTNEKIKKLKGITKEEIDAINNSDFESKRKLEGTNNLVSRYRVGNFRVIVDKYGNVLDIIGRNESTYNKQNIKKWKKTAIENNEIMKRQKSKNKKRG